MSDEEFSDWEAGAEEAVRREWWAEQVATFDAESDGDAR